MVRPRISAFWTTGNFFPLTVRGSKGRCEVEAIFKVERFWDCLYDRLGGTR